MKSRVPSSKADSVRCPGCGASFHAQPSARRVRVQCPKCREIVVLGKVAPDVKGDPAPDAKGDPVPDAPRTVAAPPDDFASLTARVEAIERTMAGLQEKLIQSPRGSRMRWIAPGEQPDFSDLQAEALRGNLAALPAHHITIEVSSGDIHARERADWFKTVFKKARWSVRGPEDAPSARVIRPGVWLATGLPVSAEAAVTFLAVRAAGFDIATLFDADLSDDDPRLVVA